MNDRLEIGALLIDLEVKWKLGGRLVPTLDAVVGKDADDVLDAQRPCPRRAGVIQMMGLPVGQAVADKVAMVISICATADVG